MRDITDGTSNTIAVGESAYFTQWGTVAGVWAGSVNSSSGNARDANMDVVVGAMTPINRVNLAVNEFGVPDWARTYAVLFSMNSRHTGGVHVVMFDGSTRFISENIDQSGANHWEQTPAPTPATTYQRLLHISDGQTVGEF
jgi:prepilin-type processing-associated H-X9-DG protein